MLLQILPHKSRCRIQLLLHTRPRNIQLGRDLIQGKPVDILAENLADLFARKTPRKLVQFPIVPVGPYLRELWGDARGRQLFP